MLNLTQSSEQVSKPDLDRILKKLAFKMPKEFLDLYKAYNGGIPDKPEVTDGRHVFPVHEFYDWDDIVFFKEDLDSYSVPDELEHEKLLPFACDQGGNTYALYFKNAVPEVYFYTTSDVMTVHGKWSSFKDFLEHFL